MNSLLMITACLILIGTVWAEDGYLFDKRKRCTLACIDKTGDKNCDRNCKKEGGSFGHCSYSACWCKGLPGSTPISRTPGKTCKK
uniref:Toxin Cll9 n=1 Tax=Centruroides limpidus TaxID=6876 RepID=SCX9_CENLI|nr:RecName: Full=Toxin Cll9; Flags: Precursor [Centruroides limpidus]AAL57291.1 Na+-channel modifying toxin precursor [Centruroides limpidus limpidus]